MNLVELFEGNLMSEDDYDNHADHTEALQSTGFWGSAAAGGIFFAKATKRFMLCHRSQHVQEPGTFGTYGGAIDKGENPVEAVRREVYEETGFSGKFDLIPMLVFTSGSFRYSNFLIVIEEEFSPRLDWESQGFAWCEFGDWPSPLHFGTVGLLNDSRSVNIMKSYAGS